jgi:hypothetical protein
MSKYYQGVSKLKSMPVISYRLKALEEVGLDLDKKAHSV